MTPVQGLSIGRALALNRSYGLSLALLGASIACWMNIWPTPTLRSFVSLVQHS